MPDPTLPYIITGRVVDDDNVTPRTNISLSMKNVRTGETITSVTDSNGDFIFDCANFETNGYVDGDYVLVSTDSTGANGQDLRIKVFSYGYGQIDEIKVEYSIKT